MILVRTPWTRQPQTPVRLNSRYAAAGKSIRIGAMRMDSLLGVEWAALEIGAGQFGAHLGRTGAGAFALLSATDAERTIPSGLLFTLVVAVNIDFASNGPNFSLGEPGAAGAAEFDAYLPYAGDGNCYFRWGGTVDGVTSVQGSASAGGIFVLSTGPEGMQIWRNGALIASNAASPSRAAGSSQLQTGASGAGRAYATAMTATFAAQFPRSVNAALSLNPWQIFEARRVIIPHTTTGYAHPTLSNARMGSLTSTGGVPLVDYAF